MIILALIIAISTLLYRKYAELAFEHNKQRVGYGILGVGVFIGTYIISALIIGFIMGAAGMVIIDDFIITLLAELAVMGIGALASWTVLYFMRKSWEKNRFNKQQDTQILDDSL